VSVKVTLQVRRITLALSTVMDEPSSIGSVKTGTPLLRTNASEMT
jgi:hypothetical protein